MNIPASYQRFARLLCKPHTPSVKVQTSNLKSRALDRIKNFQILLNQSPQANGAGEKSMWGDYKSILARAIAYFFQCIEILRPGVKIINEYMARLLGGDLHPGNQGNTKTPCVVRKAIRPYIHVVTCDCENLKTQSCCARDQLLW